MKFKKINLVVLVFVLTLIFTVNVNAQTETQQITDIAVEGNQNVIANEILAVVQTELGENFNREKIKNDLQAVYDMGYFQDVTVNFRNYEGGLQVIFEVEENPVLEKINIEGNQVYSKEQIVEWIDVNVDKILNLNNLNEGLKNVVTKYEDNGYILINFEDVNFSPEGELNLKIDLGHINDIVLSGNQKTRDYVIFREINLEKGAVLNINDIREASRKVYRLNYFEDINPELKRISEDSNEVDVVFNLTEKKTGNFNFGGGYSSKDGWFGFVKVKESNLGGNGQTLGFNYQFGKNTNYNLNFYEPYLMGSPTSFSANIYKRKTDKEDYTEDVTGGSISLGHDLIRGWRGTARYKLENSVITSQSEDVDDETNEIRSITLKADKDTTNNPFNPTSGLIASLSTEQAGYLFGGDANFNKYNADIRKFYSGFKVDHAWALRFMAGTSTGVLPTSEKYNLGGADTLRGYDSYSFTGDDMILTQIEYRLPVADNFTGVIFTDGGNVWENGDTIKLHDLHVGVGLGVRLNTPIGQIRLDYGWDQEGKGMPHFSIGNTF